jgi:hypothetical protein
MGDEGPNCAGDENGTRGAKCIFQMTTKQDCKKTESSGTKRKVSQSKNLLHGAKKSAPGS